ncbi:hypothetical protein [Novosphingobium album (ex Liu et al. 2023)]|uniref:Uncharacterized protein n=1 Tax=Novosphingobium album (ex Liu et al. 2023) TaxID=3031130 RepID=A0ABT5WPD8_9SPHN|nr:hypothetical protein [Novosphingobium album (ex Liu et al. 2023)]MDE8651871.1 hypothetical protein [Novosphingobium album (ex Liu et al. 2023)]
MILALRGAKVRAEGEFRNTMANAWLGGLLGQIDPRSYPKLEALIGDGQRSQSAPRPADPEEAHQNLRAWGAWLKVVNRQAEGRSRKE